MKTNRIATFLCSLLLVSCVLTPIEAETTSSPSTIFLVRHAEKMKTADNPDLTESGARRAEALARVLQDAGIERILSTDYKRTRQTAAPLSKQLNLPVEIYDPHELEQLVSALQADGQNQVVVGHSNTTPDVVKLLGADPGPEIDEEHEFDRLYIVTIDGDGMAKSVILRYGPSP